MRHERFTTEMSEPDSENVVLEQLPTPDEEDSGIDPVQIENFEDWHSRCLAHYEESLRVFAEDSAALKEILEQGSGLSGEEIAEARAETGIAEKLWKLGQKAEGLLVRYSKKIEVAIMGDKERVQTVLENSFPRDAHVQGVMLERDLRNERTISEPVIKEAISKRNEILEARGLLTLSKEAFNTYFSSHEFEVRADLQQGNVGDCYAVAAIHAFSCSPHFEMIVRSAMVRREDGTWVVRMPLLDENSKLIEIEPAEISTQKNERFMKQKQGGESGVDTRENLHPLAGKEGLRVLEAAFIKNKFGTVDRLAAEGGQGEDVLVSFGGNNFVSSSVHASAYDSENKRYVHGGLDQLGQHNTPWLEETLENFDPEVHIATAGTKHFDSSSLMGALANKVGAYKGKGTMQFFVPGHAYSVAAVDKEARTVTVTNPWNTANKILLTFEQFKGTFSSLSSIRVDNAKLIENMNKITRQAA